MKIHKQISILLIVLIGLSQSFTAYSQGDSCANAIPITSLPFSYTGTTCGFGRNYSANEACGMYSMSGEDIMFSYTPTQNENISTNLTTDASSVGIVVSNGCPNVGTCVGSITNLDSYALGGFSLLAGNTYIFTISSDLTSWWCIDNFTFNISLNNGGGNCLGGPACVYPIPTAQDSIQQAPLINHPVICGNINETFTNTDNAQLADVFCGMIDNNSWLKFIASDNTAIFNIYVCNCEWENGIQLGIYSSNDFSTFQSVSNCWSPGTMENGIITANNLTIGETYYVMFDSFADDICDYTLTAISGVEVDNSWVEETGSSYSVLNNGSILNLRAYGGTSYQWVPNVGLNNANIANPIASIDTSITYTCIISDGSKTQITSDVTIAVITTLTSAITACNGVTNTYTVSGELTFNGIPENGYITIRDNSGANHVFNAPFTNPLPYSFSNLPANGTNHTITASFCDLNTNQLIVNYIAASGCSSCSGNAGNDINTCGLSAQLQAIDSLSYLSRNWSSLQADVVFANNQNATTLVTVPSLGTYNFVWQIINASGLVCTDTVTYIFNSLPQNPVISFDNTTLTSDIAVGNQWYNQNGIIAGATDQTYTPTVSGTYYSVVEVNGCSSQNSNSIQVVIADIETHIKTADFILYPNPANNMFYIEFSDSHLTTSIYHICNSTGQHMLSGKISNTKTAILTQSLPDGIYTISIMNEKWVKNVKLVINK